MNTNYIDFNVVTESLGLESMQALAQADTAVYGVESVINRTLGNFSKDSDARCYAIMGKYIKPVMESAWGDVELKKKDFWTNASLGLERAAHEFVTSPSKFQLLPKDIQKMLKPMNTQKVALESAMAKLGKGHKDYIKLEMKHKAAKFSMESMLFNHFSNLQTKRVLGNMIGGAVAGLESYSYQNAIYYPKLEAMTQWVNVTAAIYPKLIKIKQLLNEITSIPVHTQEVWVDFLNDAGQIVRSVRREDLYSNMVPVDVPEAYDAFDRELILKKADFGKDIFLRTTILDGETQPFITPNELVRSDISVTDVKLADGTSLGPVFDPKAGMMQGEAINEMDWKGKVIKIVPNRAEPEKYYKVAAEFDGSDQMLSFAQSYKSNAEMKDIEEVHFLFKIRDNFMTQKAKTDFRVRETRGFINAAAINRIDIPLVQTELDALDGRLQGNFLNKITNLASEYITHDKDNKFWTGYTKMKAKIVKDFNQDPNKVLYADYTTDMDIARQVNKVEALNLYLGTAMRVLKDKLNAQGNTSTDVQLNIFTHTLHLPVIDPVLQIITGTVDEDANGKFLGVAQDARTYVLTLGTETSTPVQSVVVGTDKWDLMARPDKGAAAEDIEFNFHVLPVYKESNMETSLFVETPTRVISDNAIRSNRHPFVPSLLMEYSSKFETLRATAADLTIKGFYANPLVSLNK